jgi:N-acetylglucosaminyldiphosphoundecaprenol N-acetyl-beta-D-mannosaminyltransferase
VNSTEDILGFHVTRARKTECVDAIVSWASSNGPTRYFACVNPHSIEIARRDSEFARALRDADLAVPDGVGILLASRLLGGTIRDRVTGSDLFWGVNARLNERGGKSVFFLGSTLDNLEAIRERMARDFPRVRIAGLLSPPFAPEFGERDDRAMIDAVNTSGADVLWVGMTAPKQERWVHAHRARLRVKAIGPVGAVFDFFTGRVRRSHPVFQRMGLEWLPRLAREPRRLWRRNFVSNPTFLARVVCERLSSHR